MPYPFLFTRQNTLGLCPGDEWRGNKLFQSRSEAERRNTSGLCPGVVYSHRATNPHWRWKLLKSLDFLIFALLVRFSKCDFNIFISISKTAPFATQKTR